MTMSLRDKVNAVLMHIYARWYLLTNRSGRQRSK
jgi:hypothetical protein